MLAGFTRNGTDLFFRHDVAMTCSLVRSTWAEAATHRQSLRWWQCGIGSLRETRFLRLLRVVWDMDPRVQRRFHEKRRRERCPKS